MTAAQRKTPVSRRARQGVRRIGLFAVVVLSTSVLPAAQATFAAEAGTVPAGSVLRVLVPEAIGGKTVVGQLTVDRVTAPGFVTA